MLRELRIMKIIYKFIFVISVLIYTPLYSSGSYSPSGGSLTREEYIQGKAIYHGRIEIAEFPSCISCHDSSNKLKRRNFEKVGIDQQVYKEHCMHLNNCQVLNVSDQHWDALMYFLKKRYRIKN